MVSPTQRTLVWSSSGSWWRTGKPGVLQSMGLQRVRYDWATEQQQIFTKYFYPENRRKYIESYSPRGCKDSDVTEHACMHAQESNIFVCSREIGRCRESCRVYQFWLSHLPTWAVRTERVTPLNSIILIL